MMIRYPHLLLCHFTELTIFFIAGLFISGLFIGSVPTSQPT